MSDAISNGNNAAHIPKLHSPQYSQGNPNDKNEQRADWLALFNSELEAVTTKSMEASHLSSLGSSRLFSASPFLMSVVGNAVIDNSSDTADETTQIAGAAQIITRFIEENSEKAQHTDLAIRIDVDSSLRLDAILLTQTRDLEKAFRLQIDITGNQITIWIGLKADVATKLKEPIRALVKQLVCFDSDSHLDSVLLVCNGQVLLSGLAKEIKSQVSLDSVSDVLLTKMKGFV